MLGVDKSGAWYSFEGERIGQGRENVKEFLRQNPDMANNIKLKIRDKAGLDRTQPAPQNEETAEVKQVTKQDK